MIYLAAAAVEAIRKHASDAFPEECCGLLGGGAADGTKRVVTVVPLPNARIDSPHNRYFASGEAIRRAEAVLKAHGLETLGFYHSHPNAPAQPSPYDLAHATWPWYSYIIVAAREGRSEEMTSWILADDRRSFVAENIRFTDSANADASGPAGTADAGSTSEAARRRRQHRS